MFRKEYPRPQYARKEWRSLNGLWEFEFADNKRENQSYYLGSQLSGQIAVPFAPGAPLSGVNSLPNPKSVWYKKIFSLSKIETFGTVLLNFNAVDYRSEVYINGHLAAVHKGALPFTADITAFIKQGENIVVINALDDETDPAIPSGFQGKNLKGSQPSVTGIWGSVWLEFAGKSYIYDCFAYCNPEKQEIILKGALSFPLTDGYFSVEVSYEGKLLSKHRYKAAKDFFLSVPVETHLDAWGALDGKIYDIDISLTDATGQTSDSLRLYTFFRNLEIKDKRLYINGKQVIIRGVNDYGFYKGGGATAPSADIIKQDFLKLISLGFNAVRPVQRIVEPVYLYYADMLGLLVIEDYPSYGMDFDLDSAAMNIQSDWLKLIKRGFRHPSIILRQPIYSGCQNGEAQCAMYKLIKSLDSSRLLMSGGLVFKADITDINISGLTLEEILPIVLDRKNGLFKTKREERALRKCLPPLISDSDYSALPFIVSGLGIDFLSGDRNGEREVLSSFETISSAVLSAGAAGYIYSALCDTQSLITGFVDINRDSKLSRGGESEIQRINSLGK